MDSPIVNPIKYLSVYTITSTMDVRDINDQHYYELLYNSIKGLSTYTLKLVSLMYNNKAIQIYVYIIDDDYEHDVLKLYKKTFSVYTINHYIREICKGVLKGYINEPLISYQHGYN